MGRGAAHAKLLVCPRKRKKRRVTRAERRKRKAGRAREAGQADSLRVESHYMLVFFQLNGGF